MINLNMFTTAWAPAPDCPDLFMVSSLGHLYSLRSNRIVAQNPMNGYLAHVTKVGGRAGVNVVLKTHLQVARAFIANPCGLPEVNHIDGNKFNPAWWNLEWTTHKGNMTHAIQTGLWSTRPLFSVTEFTEEQVRYITLNPDKLTDRQMGIKFNRHHATIQDYRRRYSPVFL
ncbi:putative HNH endonuclease domain protein [Erwinia phage vB_EamM_MadMel]|nr:putative HNH endonuclease domain protein [Erwinia phage vB_EamM_MadMel]